MLFCLTASGSTGIVPKNGGAIEFVVHKKSGLVVDTMNFEKCSQALQTLIENNELRATLQLNSINDSFKLFPERCALKILDVMFKSER